MENKKVSFSDKEVRSEKETRKRILSDIYSQFGPVYGHDAVKQVKATFEKFDNLIKNCKNEVERDHIRKYAVAEIYKIVGYVGGLTVGGQVVIPDDGKSREQK